MQAQISQAARSAYPHLTSALFPPLPTFTEMAARMGRKIPKIRSVKSHQAAQARRADRPKVFPAGYGIADWPLVETVEADGTICIDYQGDPHYSALQIAEYVRKFCELNHLKA